MKHNKMILLTGTTGFIGSALYASLNQSQHVRPINRSQFGDLLPSTDYTNLLINIDVVIHLAARVHVMHDTATNPLEEFRRTNTATTLNLARQAAKFGVRRFIYLSSIKVNGELTLPDQPFTAEGNHIPTDPYGISKYEAEQGLKEIAQQTGMEVTIIRPPLVYGPAVKANFLNMMHWIHKGIPLPFGAIHNQRSLVALPNLVDLITTCIHHPAAANQTFLVSDAEDLSTTQLIAKLSQALGKSPRLIPIPQTLLEITLRLLGKQPLAQRLCGNLQIDITKTRTLLNWNPPFSVDEALQMTAQHYLSTL